MLFQHYEQQEFSRKRIRTPVKQFQTGGNTMTETKNEIRVARNHKDRLFRMIFREKKELLSLYNAVNGTSYTNAEELEIVTLENAIYVKKVRTYAKSMKNVEEAVDRAVTECINEGILREFLLQNRKEAVEMSIFEYDEEAVFEIVRKDEYEKGLQEGIEKGQKVGHQEGIIAGKAEDILELLEDIGTIPNELRERISNEKDIVKLNQWLKQAAKAESIEEFMSKM